MKKTDNLTQSNKPGNILSSERKNKIRKEQISKSYDSHKKGTEKIIKVNLKINNSAKKRQDKINTSNSSQDKKEQAFIHKESKDIPDNTITNVSSTKDKAMKTSTTEALNSIDVTNKNNGDSQISNNITSISLNNGKTTIENTMINANTNELKNILKQKSDIINKINNIINQGNLNEKQLFANLKILLDDYPVINKFDKVKSSLLSKEDFDIFNKYDNKKFLFIANLYNLISVINLLWEESNYSPSILIKYITNLDLYFSFVEDEETSEVDFVLMAPLSKNLYNYISSYGKYLFNDRDLSDKAKSFNDFSQKYQYDVGYYFEDMNTINLLHSIGESNYKLLPKIIYYVKQKAAENLTKLKIINAPKLIKFHDPTKDQKEYSGYNEIDLCLFMKKKKIIKENENFKFITREYNLNSALELQNNYNYFFEFKNEASDIDTFHTNKMVKRFVNALKNIEITENIKFDLNKIRTIFFCNKEYKSSKTIIQQKKIKKDIMYSNPQVGMNILLKYDNKIKYLEQNIDIINNEMGELKTTYDKKLEEQNDIYTKKLEEQKKVYNEQLVEKEKSLKNKMDEYINEIKKEFELKSYYREYESCKNMLSIIDIPLDIKYLIKSSKILDNNDFERYKKIYDFFVSISEPFVKIKENSRSLFSRINKYIGKNITNPEEKKEWMNIRSEIIKVSKKEYVHEYYEGLLLFLYGKNYLKNEDYDILSEEKYEQKKLVKQLIIFLSIFEGNYNGNIDKFEAKFQSAILYIAYKLLGSVKISNKLREAKNNMVDNIKSDVKENVKEKEKEKENENEKKDEKGKEKEKLEKRIIL